MRVTPPPPDHEYQDECEGGAFMQILAGLTIRQDLTCLPYGAAPLRGPEARAAP